jgi:hypothetical protein
LGLASREEEGKMGFWPFKKREVRERSDELGPLDYTVHEAEVLAMAALAPLLKTFPTFRPVIESNLEEVWDLLVGIAMAGVALHTRGVLSNPAVREELKEALVASFGIGSGLLDDYYEYADLRTRETTLPWSGVSAMWVADSFRLHPGANDALRASASTLDFVNPLASFISLSFGSMGAGVSDFVDRALREIEKREGSDMAGKLSVRAIVHETYVAKVVELVREQCEEK